MKDQLTSLRDEYVDDVGELLRDVIREESPRDSQLVDMGNYHLDTGGKRLRAVIPLAVGRALGEEPSRLVPFAAGCELLHNATLVHDDLQDGDETRRNHPTVWKKFGRPHAVNLGDAMLYWAVACLDRLEVSDTDYRACVRRFLGQTLEVIDGQEREFALMSRTAPSKSEYLQMVEGKTGGLFVLSAAGAAELADASPDVVDDVSTAARHLGVLFQVQDDILDLYGDKGRGERGADLREGKMSALAVLYLERADEERAAELREVLDRPRDAVEATTIETFAERFRDAGALRAALAELEDRRDAAIASVDGADVRELRRLVAGVADLFVAPIDHLL